MKYILGFLLIASGLVALALCLQLRGQLAAVTAQADPDLEEYPLLQLVLPEPESGARPSRPAELAQRASLRIYAIGGSGLILVVAGAILCFLRGAKRPSSDGEG